MTLSEPKRGQRPPADEESAISLARSLVHKHGKSKFRTIIAMLEANRPGTEIAKKFQVTKQRVSQWRRIFGIEKTAFTVRDSVRRFSDVA